MSNEWKMVPVNPTKEQTLAVCMHPDLARSLYFSMVSAAPVPPAGDVEVLGCAIKDYPYSLRHSRSELDKLTIPFADDQIVELVDRAHVTRLTAERDGLLAEVERLKNLPHGQILAESAGRHLLNSGAENFVGDVFTIEADDGTTKFEIVVTTQKVGAKSPGEVCNELQSELTEAREDLRLEKVAGAAMRTQAEDFKALSWERGQELNKARELLHTYFVKPDKCAFAARDIGEFLLEKETCDTCNGTKVVDDGEINSSGGIDFENGPVQRIKDCPDCAPAAKGGSDE